MRTWCSAWCLAPIKYQWMLAFIIIIDKGSGDIESSGFDQRAGWTDIIIWVGL